MLPSSLTNRTTISYKPYMTIEVIFIEKGQFAQDDTTVL